MRSFILIFMTALLTVGCATVQTFPECVPEKVTGNGLRFKGIEIPIGTIVPVKIGEFSWQPEQVAALSDAVLALTNGRLTQCLYVNASLKTVPPATVAQLILIRREFVAGDAEANRLFFAIKNGTAVKDVLIIAQSAKAAAAQADQKVEEILAPSVQPATDPSPADPPKALSSPLSMKDMPEGLARRLTGFDDSISLLAKKQTSSEVLTINVTGYPISGIKLDSVMKAGLIRGFEKAHKAIGSAKPYRLTVIGYADGSGTRLRNVDISLRRAEEVAGFLASQFPAQIYIASVSSGGIRIGLIDARSVDVIISAT